MLTTNFGIEIEMTGITRKTAAQVAKTILGGTVLYDGSYYDTWVVHAPDGRIWQFTYDGSIRTQKREDGRRVGANRSYSTELVSPILRYENDIETLQQLIRALRKAGAFVNNTCGIHIHIDGAAHTSRSIRNFVNIIHARNDLFYKALNIEERRIAYCKKLDKALMEQMNRKKPTTLEQVENVWYAPYGGDRTRRYHNSRYHFLNLHSFFNGHGTVELRGFNATLHAGEVRSYIILALALNNQALTQKFASTRKPQVENEKFAMRTYLNRIGLIGDDFKACRNHLTKHLSGSSAWRHRQVA